jgi:hypothetical protein
MAFPFSLPTTLKPFVDQVLVWLHGRRLGIVGDGEQTNTVNATSSLLILDGVPIGSTRSGPASVPIPATGLSAAGSITITGAVIGDTVLKVYDVAAALWVDVSSSFESVISVNNAIQETASVTNHAIVVFLQPGS